jgi:branched-chain amino acid transport system permease protein
MFGLMGILNFAHINFMVICVYASLFVYSFISNAAVAAILGVVIMCVAGLAIYITLITPVFKFGLDAAMMNTFALSYFLEVLILAIFGPFYKNFPYLFPDIRIAFFGGITYSSYRLMVALVASLVIGSLFLVIRKTMFGMALRAVMQDTIGASLLGIKIKKITMIGFMVSIILAGVAGILIAPMYSVHPTFLDRLLPISFAVTIVGGLGNIEGALVAGLIIGIADSVGGVYVSSAYKDAIIFLLLIIVLLFRPRGIFGRR